MPQKKYYIINSEEFALLGTYLNTPIYLYLFYWYVNQIILLFIIWSDLASVILMVKIKWERNEKGLM